jgi:hypothetical protein
MKIMLTTSNKVMLSALAVPWNDFADTLVTNKFIINAINSENPKILQWLNKKRCEYKLY